MTGSAFYQEMFKMAEKGQVLSERVQGARAGATAWIETPAEALSGSGYTALRPIRFNSDDDLPEYLRMLHSGMTVADTPGEGSVFSLYFRLIDTPESGG